MPKGQPHLETLAFDELNLEPFRREWYRRWQGTPTRPKDLFNVMLDVSFEAIRCDSPEVRFNQILRYGARNGYWHASQVRIYGEVTYQLRVSVAPQQPAVDKNKFLDAWYAKHKSYLVMVKTLAEIMDPKGVWTQQRLIRFGNWLKALSRSSHPVSGYRVKLEKKIGGSNTYRIIPSTEPTDAAGIVADFEGDASYVEPHKCRATGEPRVTKCCDCGRFCVKHRIYVAE